MATTIFQRSGGFAAVSKIVLSFYDRVLDSDVLAPYFEDIDLRRLVDHQTKFVAFLMGGPPAYSDAVLRETHAHLGIDRPAFDEMIALMEETLEDFELDPDDVAAIVHQLESRAPLIVTRA